GANVAGVGILGAPSRMRPSGRGTSGRGGQDVAPGVKPGRWDIPLSDTTGAACGHSAGVHRRTGRGGAVLLPLRPDTPARIGEGRGAGGEVWAGRGREGGGTLGAG